MDNIKLVKDKNEMVNTILDNYKNNYKNGEIIFLVKLENGDYGVKYVLKEMFSFPEIEKNEVYMITIKQKDFENMVDGLKINSFTCFKYTL